MTQEEKTDQVLLIFYRQTKDGQLYSMSESIGVKGQVLNKTEIEEIKKVLESKKLVKFQSVKTGFRGQITFNGIEFVRTTSFATPGTPLLNLIDKK